MSQSKAAAHELLGRSGLPPARLASIAEEFDGLTTALEGDQLQPDAPKTHQIAPAGLTL